MNAVAASCSMPPHRLPGLTPVPGFESTDYALLQGRVVWAGTRPKTDHPRNAHAPWQPSTARPNATRLRANAALLDQALMMTSFVTVSAPQFVVSLLLLYVFAVKLGWFSTVAMIASAMLWIGTFAALASAANTPTTVSRFWVEATPCPQITCGRSSVERQPPTAWRCCAGNGWKSVPSAYLG